MMVFYSFVHQFLVSLSLQIIIAVTVHANAGWVGVGGVEKSKISPSSHLKYHSVSVQSSTQTQNPIFKKPVGSNSYYFQQEEHQLDNNYYPFSSYELRYPSFQASQFPDQANKNQVQRQDEGEKEKPASSSTHSEGEATKSEENLSPFEQAFNNLTSPEQLIPIINDLTFITLIILHLPVIIPTILIPLAFFGVGSLLIPFVRVNYFINHKDNDEDGRQLMMSGLEYILSFINDNKMW